MHNIITMDNTKGTEVEPFQIFMFNTQKFIIGWWFVGYQVNAPQQYHNGTTIPGPSPQNLDSKLIQNCILH